MINSKLKEKYLSMYPQNELQENIAQDIEETLDVVLPNDFKNIIKYCHRLDNISSLDLFSFDEKVNGWNIYEKTKFFRMSIHLPKKYIVLKEGDESFIVLETQDDPNQPASVIWCGEADAYNLVEGKPLIDNPKIFPTFTDFFMYLLDEEEKKREEESIES
jgi:hypothetical protein